jgi:hypothetical protein
MSLKSIITTFMYIFYKAGGSENKFRESQIRKFANLNNRGFLRFADPIFFVVCGLQTSASPQIHILSPYKYSIKTLTENFTE